MSTYRHTSSVSAIQTQGPLCGTLGLRATGANTASCNVQLELACEETRQMLGRISFTALGQPVVKITMSNEWQIPASVIIYAEPSLIIFPFVRDLREHKNVKDVVNRPALYVVLGDRKNFSGTLACVEHSANGNRLLNAEAEPEQIKPSPFEGAGSDKLKQTLVVKKKIPFAVFDSLAIACYSRLFLILEMSVKPRQFSFDRGNTKVSIVQAARTTEYINKSHWDSLYLVIFVSTTSIRRTQDVWNTEHPAQIQRVTGANAANRNAAPEECAARTSSATIASHRPSPPASLLQQSSNSHHASPPFGGLRHDA